MIPGCFESFSLPALPSKLKHFSKARAHSSWKENEPERGYGLHTRHATCASKSCASTLPRAESPARKDPLHAQDQQRTNGHDGHVPYGPVSCRFHFQDGCQGLVRSDPG